MMPLFIVFILLVFSPPLMAFDQALLCSAEKAYASNLTYLTAVGKFTEKYLMKKDIFGPSAEEILFIKNNPDAALVILNSACASLGISYGICGIDILKNEASRGWDEEVDAIRHFIFSALLACSRGKTFAEKYTIAHEGAPPWNDGGKMDIHNNYKGIEWADPKFGRCNLPALEKRLMAAVLKALRDGQLTTLRKGDTYCKDPQETLKKVEAMSDESTLELLVKNHASLKKAYPQFCK